MSQSLLHPMTITAPVHDHAAVSGKHAATRPDSCARLAAYAAIAVAWSLPLATLGRQSLWWDEAWTWFQATHETVDVVRLSWQVEPHPPLYYLLVHWLTALAGTSEFALRFLSVAAGPLLVAAGFGLARRFSAPAGVWAALLLAVFPFQISYAQSARNYAPAAAAAMLAVLFFERARERPRRLRVVAFVLATLAAWYLHVLAVLPVLAYVAARLVQTRQRPRWLAWAACGLLVGALPWLVPLVGHTLAPAVPPWRSSPSPDYLLGQTPLWLLAGPVQGIWPLPVVWGLAILAGLLIVWGMSGPYRALAVPAAAACVAPVVLLAAGSLATPVFHVRYLGLFAPFAALSVAAGMAAGLRWSRGGGVVLLGAGAAASVAWVTGAQPNDDLRAAARALESEMRPGDAVIVTAAWARLGLDYYQPAGLRWTRVLGATDGSRAAAAGQLLTADSGSPGAAATSDTIQAFGIGFVGTSPVRETVWYPVSDWSATQTALERLAEDADRIWLFRLYDTIADPEGRVAGWFDERYPLLREETFAGPSSPQLRLYRTALPDPTDPAEGFTRANLPVPEFGELLGWRWLPVRTKSPERATLQIVWQTSGRPAHDLRTFVHLLDGEQRQVGGTDGVTGAPVPLATRAPGDLVLDEIDITIPDPPLSWPVHIGLYDAESGRRLPIGEVESLAIGTTPLSPSRADASDPLAHFANGADLLDVALPERPLKPGEQAALRLTWRLAPETFEAVTVFLHLVDADGRPLAQADGPIRTGAATPAYLPDFDTIAEERSLTMPDVPAGSYEVRVGLYSPQTGARIAVGGPAVSGNHAHAGRLTIAP